MIGILKVLEWTVPLSLGVVFILFMVSAQYAHGMGWCVGIFFFWAFVGGLMLDEMKRAGADAQAIKTTRIANVCFQSAIQATLIGFALMLSRDVKRRLFNDRCPKCGNWNVKTVLSGGGTYKDRRVVAHFDERDNYVGRSEYVYDTGISKGSSYNSQECRDCGYSWFRKDQTFKDR